MNNPDFYLASSEGYGLETPRRCWRIKRISTDSRDDLLLLKIDPPLIGQEYGLGSHDIEFILVATRYKGSSLFPINEWPIYVHVIRSLIDNIEHRNKLSNGEFESIGWAEIYKTEEDAQSKVI